MLILRVSDIADKLGFPHQERYCPESPWAHSDELPGSSEESLRSDGEQLLPQVYPVWALQRTVCRRQRGEQAHKVLVKLNPPTPEFIFHCDRTLNTDHVYSKHRLGIKVPNANSGLKRQQQVWKMQSAAGFSPSCWGSSTRKRVWSDWTLKDAAGSVQRVFLWDGIKVTVFTTRLLPTMQFYGFGCNDALLRKYCSTPLLGAEELKGCDSPVIKQTALKECIFWDTWRFCSEVVHFSVTLFYFMFMFCATIAPVYIEKLQLKLVQ